jgi:hypothetical protein
MIYVPHVAKFLDFPDIQSLRAPLPTMVQSCTEDPLFSIEETARAHDMIATTFEKAGARERFRGEIYGGGHKFDGAMQESAFQWFDAWLTT